MPALRFTGLTFAGSALWNCALVGAGYALGTQWKLVDKYSVVLDVLVVGGLVVLVGSGLVRRLRRRQGTAAS